MLTDVGDPDSGEKTLGLRAWAVYAGNTAHARERYKRSGPAQTKRPRFKSDTFRCMPSFTKEMFCHDKYFWSVTNGAVQPKQNGRVSDISSCNRPQTRPGLGLAKQPSLNPQVHTSWTQIRAQNTHSFVRERIIGLPCASNNMSSNVSVTHIAKLTSEKSKFFFQQQK